MDLYYASGELNGKQWHVCITDCFYLKLKEFNKPYKGTLDKQPLEIPWKQFKKEIKCTPVMMKYNGTVDYELDPNDYTKKKDGTPSDINNNKYNGNVMMQYQKEK